MDRIAGKEMRFSDRGHTPMHELIRQSRRSIEQEVGPSDEILDPLPHSGIFILREHMANKIARRFRNLHASRLFPSVASSDSQQCY
jgi:hypothetical protein